MGTELTGRSSPHTASARVSSDTTSPARASNTATMRRCFGLPSGITAPSAPRSSTAPRTRNRTATRYGPTAAGMVKPACNRPAIRRRHSRSMSTAIEQLTTGWEPEVPVGDTLVRRYLFHFASLCDAFARAAGGHTLESATLRASDLGHAGGYWNSATLLRPPVDWHATLDEVECFFAGGTGEVMLSSAWPTPDLRARGWRISGHPPLLVRPPAAQLPLPPVPEGNVRTVHRRSELAQWERIAIEAYPLPELAELPPGDHGRRGPAPGRPPALRDRARRPDVSTISFVDHGLGSLAFGTTQPGSAPPRSLATAWRRRGSARCPIFGSPASSVTSADPAPNDSASSPSSASPCGSTIADATPKAFDPGGLQ